ncbi:hypothetical protein Golomagni_03565 [Golovinomyces magnicellulatus]|nr:hypothetical protein Golomagni_03565 [Golovinomyces magnicellulatus]
MEHRDQMTSADSPTSRFTAVNSIKDQTIRAGSVVALDGNSLGNCPSRRELDEKSGDLTRLSPRDQENLSLVTTSITQKEDWITASTNGERNTYQLPHPHFGTEALHKRKRSDSTSNNPDHSTAISITSSKQIPPIGLTESDFAREESIQQQFKNDSRESYSSDTHYKQYLTPIEERESAQESEPWNIRPFVQQTHMTSDEQIGQALKQASQNLDASGHQQGISSLSSQNDRIANSQPRSEPKKRKRNFSNRTKTGCMTCRKRKKKCDETKPECNNCMRGGFVCTGYQQRGSWPKQDQKSTPVILQSKTDYENSPYGLVNPYLTTAVAGHQRREPLPGYRGQSLRVDLRQDNHPIEGDHESISSNFVSSQIPTPVTATSSAHPDRNLKNIYDRVVPLSDLNQQEPRTEDDSGNMILLTSSTIHQNLNQPLHGDTAHTNPQIAAQLALSNLASTSRSCPSNEENLGGRPTQKEEMLAGRLYFPYDKQLVRERDICRGACWRFNNSINPDTCTSSDQRARYFREILYPRPIGEKFIVEAPFTCDYGYNISIGHDVVIGKNCTIMDACEVQIGDRCHIGPNVNIYTVSLPIDPKKRLGAKGPQQGKKVIIESDCWIGGEVIILPGRTIGKGATVGAGSVVTKASCFLNVKHNKTDTFCYRTCHPTL